MAHDVRRGGVHAEGRAEGLRVRRHRRRPPVQGPEPALDLEVNYCASKPDRSPGADPAAPRSAPGAATVYVNLEETEGYYDECMTTARAVELAQRSAPRPDARGRGRPAVERPVRVPRRARLRRRRLRGGAGFVPAGGGVLMIGDSLTWRGSDELGRLRPTFTLDGEPARPPTELASRLAFFRAGHGSRTG